MEANTISGVDPQRYLLPDTYKSSQNIALMVGAIGTVACIIGFLTDHSQFFKSYLVGWMFWLMIALGSLGWLMINHLTAGGWGIVLRRPWEAASRTIPVLAILSLPFFFGMGDIFSWARPEAAQDALIQAKAAYLDTGFFWVRWVIYFGILSIWAFLLSGRSRQQDETGDPNATRRLRNLSGPGLVLYVIATSFMAWDWLMSLQPHWFSSLYGFWFVSMTALSALAFSCILAWSLDKRQPMVDVFREKHFHDMGKLVLALTMFWAYMTLSQFLISWAGNIPEFIIWYTERNQGGWKPYTYFLIIFHFFVPFLILLSAAIKKRPRQLALVALYMLVMQWVDIYWQAGPAWHKQLTIHWLDFAAVAAVGGFWLFLFFYELRKRTLLPINDPHIMEVLPHES